jgi:hypothetical protein
MSSNVLPLHSSSHHPPNQSYSPLLTIQLKVQLPHLKIRDFLRFYSICNTFNRYTYNLLLKLSLRDWGAPIFHINIRYTAIGNNDLHVCLGGKRMSWGSPGLAVNIKAQMGNIRLFRCYRKIVHWYTRGKLVKWN